MIPLKNELNFEQMSKLCAQYNSSDLISLMKEIKMSYVRQLIDNGRKP